eukprot:3732379-Pleurochrysis_carterae.AAC.2
MCTAIAVALRVAAYYCGAYFEASYKRPNGLTKQNTKHTVADDSQVGKNLGKSAAFTLNTMSTKNV